MEKKAKNLAVSRTQAQTFKVGDQVRVLDTTDNSVADKGSITSVEPGKVVIKPTYRYYKESPKGLIFYPRGVEWVSKRYTSFRLVKG